VRGARECRDAFHLRQRAQRTRCHEQDHDDERGPGEAARGARRVGASVGARVAPGRAEQPRERDEAANPEARPDDVHDVDGHRGQRARRHGGRVTGRAQEAEREHGEQERLGTRGDPVRTVGHARASCQERGDQDQHGMTGEPHQPGPRVEHGA
jgi:hypothetical protein